MASGSPGSSGELPVPDHDDADPRARETAPPTPGSTASGRRTTGRQDSPEAELLSPSSPPGEKEPLAIVALVVSLAAGALFSLGLGIAALVKIRRHDSGGTGMAIAAIVFSILGTVLWSLVGLEAWSRHERTNNVVLDPEVGDCLPNVPEVPVDTIKKVNCTSPHSAQVFAVFHVPDASFDSITINDNAEAECWEAAPWSSDRVEAADPNMKFLFPSEEGWERGDRQIICIFEAQKTPWTTSILP